MRESIEADADSNNVYGGLRGLLTKKDVKMASFYFARGLGNGWRFVSRMGVPKILDMRIGDATSGALSRIFAPILLSGGSSECDLIGKGPLRGPVLMKLEKLPRSRRLIEQQDQSIPQGLDSFFFEASAAGLTHFSVFGASSMPQGLESFGFLASTADSLGHSTGFFASAAIAGAAASMARAGMAARRAVFFLIDIDFMRISFWLLLLRLGFANRLVGVCGFLTGNVKGL